MYKLMLSILGDEKRERMETNLKREEESKLLLISNSNGQPNSSIKIYAQYNTVWYSTACVYCNIL